jgi:hypothetical protein
MVKYCAIQKARPWRLSLDAAMAQRTLSNATVQPFRFNLLELYRDHRDEIDGLTDSAALFVLAYANYVGRITPKALAHQVGLTATTPLSALAPLLRGQMITQQGDVSA